MLKYVLSECVSELLFNNPTVNCNALVTLPKKWAEPGLSPNLNFGTVKISRLGRGFSPHYHTDLCKFGGNV